jgi:Na+-translocating ferredoxin:NAD+ oxidoreductase RnfG subunit
MAKTIARAFGHDSSRTKETTRLGHKASTGQANTWRTFTTCHVREDGSGYVEVKRDGVTLHTFTFGAEGA